jgi:hypothetical protein
MAPFVGWSIKKKELEAYEIGSVPLGRVEV